MIVTRPAGYAARPVVYFARTVDGCDRGTLLAQGRSVAAALLRHGLDLHDPVATSPPAGTDPWSDPVTMVESELRNLRRSAGLLVDMSAPAHSHISCGCALTYAYLWQIPAVMWVGRTGLDRQPWLSYHARAVVSGRDEAVTTMAALLSAPAFTN